MNPRKALWAGIVAPLAILSVAGASRADIVSDQAAALLVYPRIVSGSFGMGVGQETLIQLSNTSNAPQRVHCYYIDAVGRCSGNDRVCDPLQDPCGASEGLCVQRWVETDFDVVLTPRQPLAWVASQGLAGSDLPLDGRSFFGIGGSSNAGSRIPPVAQPFLGELKCIAVDGRGLPVANNSLIGHATLVDQDAPTIAVEKHNAIGIKAREGDANEDKILVLGGDGNEYNGCPQVLIANHFFDFAVPTPELGEVVSRLVLVPCTQDLQTAIPGRTTVQFLVFNEFEQRFSTSAPVECYFDRQISSIDTRNPQRSIFSVFVAGTITGQTRIRGVTQGLLGVLVTFTETSAAASNLHFQGEREQADIWVLP
jgi:hypothetical protein